jgi:hypothetical protein
MCWLLSIKLVGEGKRGLVEGPNGENFAARRHLDVV